MRTMRMAFTAMALGVVAATACGELWAEKPTQTISGTVKRAEVRRGKVVSVYIDDPANGEFLVLRGTTQGKELLEHVGAKVTATGYVKKSKTELDFERVIDVVSYEVASPEEASPEAAAESQDDE